jgi:hypothetical protein
MLKLLPKPSKGPQQLRGVICGRRSLVPTAFSRITILSGVEFGQPHIDADKRSSSTSPH